MNIKKIEISLFIETKDCKLWIYDPAHHEWIDVSCDNPKLKKLLKESVRI